MVFRVRVSIPTSKDLKFNKHGIANTSSDFKKASQLYEVCQCKCHPS